MSALPRSGQPDGPPRLARLTRPTQDRLGTVQRASIAFQRIDQRRFWLLAFIAGILVVAGRSITQSRSIVDGFGSLRPVAIATGHLAPGERVEETDLQWEQWPAAIAIRFPSATALEGAIVRSPIAAGEPISSSQLFGGDDVLDANERGVTLPLPLAPPPVSAGDIVDLIGLTAGFSLNDQQLIESRSLGQGRVVGIDDTGITVAVEPKQVFAIVETIAAGSVEIVVTPFGP